jgi:hypothetical protein
MLCIYGAEIYCANLIDSITENLNRCHQNLYMVEYVSNFITYCISQQINNLIHQIQVVISQKQERCDFKTFKISFSQYRFGNMLDTKTMCPVDAFPMVY